MIAKLMPLAFALMTTGCALQTFEPRPLDPARSQAELIARSPDDPRLRDVLARRGIDVSRWPLPQWDLAALTLLAYEFNADLAAASADRAIIDAERVSARAGRNPGVDFTTEHHSARGNSGSPWTFGLALDLPLTGASRRTARGAQADANAREALWQLAQRAWQVRSEVRDAYAKWHFSRLTTTALEAELALRKSEIALLDKRLAVGAVGTLEPARARQREAETTQQLQASTQAMQRARSALARAVGLAPEALDHLALAAPANLGAQNLRAEMLQRAALHERLDVRAALERYAAREAALQIEIARQIPELSIKPGYAWDQGDNRWSLGLSMLLPLFDRNAGPIAQAHAQREAEATRFIALQSRAIAELHAAQQAAAAARANLDTTRLIEARETELAQRVERRFAAGDADRLEQLGAQIARDTARRRVIEAQGADWQALGALEDAVQRPLDDIPAAIIDSTPGLAVNTIDIR